MFNSNNLGDLSDKLLQKKSLLKTVAVILIMIIFFVISLSDKMEEKPDFFNDVSDGITKQEAKKILDEYVYQSYSDLFESGFSNSYKTALAIYKTGFVKNADLKCSDLYGGSLQRWPGSNESDNAYLVNELMCRDNDIKFYGYDDVKETYLSLYNDSSLPLKYTVSINFSSIFGYSNLKNGYGNLSCECGGAPTKSLISIYDLSESDDELSMTVGYLKYDLYGDENNLEFRTSKGNILNITTDLSEAELKEETNTDKFFEDNKGVIEKYEITFNKKDDEYIFKSFKNK